MTTGSDAPPREESSDGEIFMTFQIFLCFQVAGKQAGNLRSKGQTAVSDYVIVLKLVLVA